jgi:hypothetical protein
MSTTRTPHLTARTFLVHGLLAGLLGGVLAFAAASVVGEPPIDRAIALEESGGAAADAGHSHEEGAHSHEESGGHSHGDEDAAISRGEQAARWAPPPSWCCWPTSPTPSCRG